MRGSTEEPRNDSSGRSVKERYRRRGQKRKKVDHRDYITNIQTEAGPLKDQYLIRKKEETEGEGEENIQTEAGALKDRYLLRKREGERRKKEKRQKPMIPPTSQGATRWELFNKNKANADGNRLMNLGRYPMNTYGEVLRSHQEYAKALLKEDMRGNQKARFTQWVMAFIMETFFGR